MTSPVLLSAVLFGGIYFTVKLKAFYVFHPLKVIKGMLNNVNLKHFLYLAFSVANVSGILLRTACL